MLISFVAYMADLADLADRRIYRIHPTWAALSNYSACRIVGMDDLADTRHISRLEIVDTSTRVAAVDGRRRKSCG